MNFNPTTLRPVVKPPHPTDPQVAPHRLSFDERGLGRNAANLAKQRYPGPAGVVLAREIEFWCDAGWRTDHASPIPRLIRELTAPQTPGGVSAQ